MISYLLYRNTIRLYFIVSTALCFVPIFFSLLLYGWGILHFVFLVKLLIRSSPPRKQAIWHAGMLLYYLLTFYIANEILGADFGYSREALLSMEYMELGFFLLPYMLLGGIFLLLPQFYFSLISNKSFETHHEENSDLA